MKIAAKLLLNAQFGNSANAYACLRRYVLPFAAYVSLCLSMQAQVVPNVSRKNLEVGLFGGESYGLDRFRPMAGGNIGWAISNALFPFAEASYLPGILRRQSVQAQGASTGFANQYSVDLLDIHGGLHVRLPRPESRVLPYAVVGAGVVRSAESKFVTYNPNAFGRVQVNEDVINPSVSFAVNFGAGLRFFVSERFAIRTEFKAFKPVGLPTAFSSTLR